MRLKPIIIALLMLSSAIFYYQLTGQAIQSESFRVTKVIDGDTVEIETGQRLRLKGINTPESQMPLSDEATTFLKNLVENKTIQIESYGTDKYGRFLSHIFIQDENVNAKILSAGFATLYYYEKDVHYETLRSAEEFARLNKLGLWKESPDANCLELLKLKYEEEPTRCTNNELLRIQNNCDKELQIIIKDDATHIYEETIAANSVLEKSFSCIWNDDGDTLYVSDPSGLLLFYRY